MRASDSKPSLYRISTASRAAPSGVRNTAAIPAATPGQHQDPALAVAHGEQAPHRRADGAADQHGRPLASAGAAAAQGEDRGQHLHRDQAGRQRPAPLVKGGDHGVAAAAAGLGEPPGAQAAGQAAQRRQHQQQPGAEHLAAAAQRRRGLAQRAQRLVAGQAPPAASTGSDRAAEEQRPQQPAGHAHRRRLQHRPAQDAQIQRPVVGEQLRQHRDAVLAQPEGTGSASRAPRIDLHATRPMVRVACVPVIAAVFPPLIWRDDPAASPDGGGRSAAAAPSAAGSRTASAALDPEGPEAPGLHACQHLGVQGRVGRLTAPAASSTRPSVATQTFSFRVRAWVSSRGQRSGRSSALPRRCCSATSSGQGGAVERAGQRRHPPWATSARQLGAQPVGWPARSPPGHVAGGARPAAAGR